MKPRDHEYEVAIEKFPIGRGATLRELPGLRLHPDYPNAPQGLVFRKPPALRVR